MMTYRHPDHGMWSRASEGPTFGYWQFAIYNSDMTKLRCKDYGRDFVGPMTVVELCGGGGVSVARGGVMHTVKHLEVWTMTTDISSTVPVGPRTLCSPHQSMPFISINMWDNVESTIC